MRKFGLTFVDKKIEQQYQQYLFNDQRASTFKIITIGLLITFLIKLVFGILEGKNEYVYYTLSMVIYLLVQYLFIMRKQQYVRLALLITNLSLIGFYMDKEPSSEISYLRGSNLMTANLIIILSGEFTDSVIETIILTVAKISITFSNNTIEYSVIISAILVNIAFLYYVYLFHKGRRSQFQLGLVETGWDQIFFQLIKEPCILLEFNFQNLNFFVKKFKKLSFLKTLDADDSKQSESKEKQIQNFLTNSYCGKIILQTYIYECLKFFFNQNSHYFQKSFSVKFLKQIIQIDLTIFQTKTTMVLLKLQKSPQVTLKQLKKYRQRYILLNNTFISLLIKIENQIMNNLFVKQMRRKLIIVKIMEELLNNEYQFNLVNIAYIILQLQNLYPDKILQFRNDNNMQYIHTIPNALFLILLSVMENCLSQTVKLSLVNLELEQSIMLEFIGDFRQTTIRKVYENTHYQNRLIISDVYFSKNLAQFILYFDPLCTTIDDVYTYEYQDLLLSNDY